MLKKFFTYSGFPYWFFHIPILPHYLYRSIQSRSLTYFTTANPSIYMGGFVNSSKTEYLQSLDAQYLPKYILSAKKEPASKLQSAMDSQGMSYPIIFKPNKGERGRGVVRVNNKEELHAQVEKAEDDFILQEFIDYPMEFGVLYYRFPDGTKEGISSITLKELPFIKGDGSSSITELLSVKYGQKQHYENLKSMNLDQVLQKDQLLKLEYVAHRSRNCIFRNYNHINCPQLLTVFSQIARQIPGFYFGRFDVKVNSIEDLVHGRNIKILEVNGVSSQPIHIFDPGYSFWDTYKDLYKHWTLIYEISKQNRLRGVAPVSFQSLYREIRLNG